MYDGIDETFVWNYFDYVVWLVPFHHEYILFPGHVLIV
jgi:hypothetical protein